MLSIKHAIKMLEPAVIGFSPRRIWLLKFFSTEDFALEDVGFLHGEFCS